MRQLQIHWRPRHIAPGSVAALAEVLTAFPGEDDVLVVTYGERIRLGVQVDSTARGLKKAVHEATGSACAIATDTVDAF